MVYTNQNLLPGAGSRVSLIPSLYTVVRGRMDAREAITLKKNDHKAKITMFLPVIL